MHRVLFPDATHLPPMKFDEMRARVMEAFKGNDDQAKETRGFLSDYLHNDMRYKDRLLALAEIPRPGRGSNAHQQRAEVGEIPEGLPERPGPWRRRPDRTDDGGPIYGALEVTIALLGLVLLNELGLSAEVRRRAAASQYLHLIIEQFNKALS
jgi:hypothetical protein